MVAKDNPIIYSNETNLLQNKRQAVGLTITSKKGYKILQKQQAVVV
jgi:hypothetical protein